MGLKVWEERETQRKEEESEGRVEEKDRIRKGNVKRKTKASEKDL